jgi:hypothetical protein
MKRDMIVEIPNDGRWDFVHRFRNFGEDVFRALRDSCSVDIHEIDASTSQFSVRQIPEEKTSQVCNTIQRIAEKHFFAEKIKLTTKDTEQAAAPDRQ